MRQLRYLRFWLVSGWILVGLVVLFLVIPSPPETMSFHFGDKLLHVSIYAIMMLWFGLIYPPGKFYRNLGLGFIMMGIVLEFIQGLTGYRSLEYTDMTANTIGVLLGWLLAKTRLSNALSRIENSLIK